MRGSRKGTGRAASVMVDVLITDKGALILQMHQTRCNRAFHQSPADFGTRYRGGYRLWLESLPGVC